MSNDTKSEWTREGNDCRVQERSRPVEPIGGLGHPVRKRVEPKGCTTPTDLTFRGKPTCRPCADRLEGRREDEQDFGEFLRQRAWRDLPDAEVPRRHREGDRVVWVGDGGVGVGTVAHQWKDTRRVVVLPDDANINLASDVLAVAQRLIEEDRICPLCTNSGARDEGGRLVRCECGADLVGPEGSETR